MLLSRQGLRLGSTQRVSYVHSLTCGDLLLQGLPEGLELHLAASLLQLRGVHAACAPLHAPHSGSVLCFNGEIFGGLLVPAGSNDGDVLLEALEQSLQPGAYILHTVCVWNQGQTCFMRTYVACVRLHMLSQHDGHDGCCEAL